MATDSSAVPDDSSAKQKRRNDCRCGVNEAIFYLDFNLS